MDELHLRDPGIPQVLNFFGKRSIAKGCELCSTLLELSRIEETHATQYEIPTDPVYNSKEVIPVGERKWNDTLACKSFKGDSSS